MDKLTKERISDLVRDFRLPRYYEIPDVGLYLDQVVKYIGQFLNLLGETAITASMISNYVKKGLVDNPVKKQYDRERIAYLIFIIAAKNVLSLDNLAMFIALQKRTYTTQRAYDYFCDELENILCHVFRVKNTLDIVGVDTTDEKFMLRGTIVALAHKIYLQSCFAVMAAEENNSEP